MKIRHDFVTNSSSSSFIISTNEEMHPEMKYFSTLITHENLLEIFAGNCWDQDYKSLKECGNFTVEQIMLIDLFQHGDLDSYLEVKKALDEGKTLYEISYDWDAPHSNPVLDNFLCVRNFECIADND